MDWSGYTIGEDTVKLMLHISGAIREFPTPANRTNLRSFTALVQLVSYAMAVAPKLLPFRNLLKETMPWDWGEEVDKVFREVRAQMLDMVEQGIKLFDPSRTTALLRDWCKHGIGFLFMQKHCSCPDKPDSSTNTLCCPTGWVICMVGSRFTHTAEANYSPTEGELNAVQDALHRAKYFISDART